MCGLMQSYLLFAEGEIADQITDHCSATASDGSTDRAAGDDSGCQIQDHHGDESKNATSNPTGFNGPVLLLAHEIC